MRRISLDVGVGVITWREGVLVVHTSTVGLADEAQTHRFFSGSGAAQGKASGAISACRPAYVRPVVKAATLKHAGVG